MVLRLYNTLTRKKQIFKPLKDKKVGLYTCGPTVYDFAHLGHARTYIAFDMIAKYLKQKGYNVFYLQNITDIDDKIINRAKEKRISPEKLAKDFEKEYLKDMKDLKVDSVSKYARATEHIKEIIGQVERLLKKGFAYQIEDGVYYDISKFKDYGKLSKRTALQAEDAVSRIDESKEKRNKGDFCLWKISKPGEPSWKSPWGLGRPGWHIEDTAITEKYFGPQYDIHGGGQDLIFPHHEAEIAQIEAISGKSPLVKYWLHTGFLTVKGQKMAKSLGNFITIKDFLKNYSSRILRFFALKSHYRSPIDYSENAVLEVKKDLKRLDEFLEKIQRLKSKFKIPNINIASLLRKTQKDFAKAMEDDFNTPKAIASIFQLVNEGNTLIAQNKINSQGARDIVNFLRKTDKIFGFIFRETSMLKIPADVFKLAKEREEYRKLGQWQKADEIRRKIKEMGWWVEDTKEGPKIKKL